MATRSKQKAAARKANRDNRPHATARYIRISSRKVKIVVDLIRGKKVADAQAILMYTPKSAAPVVLKLNKKSFEFWDEQTNTMRTKPGNYQLFYGTSSADKDLQTVDVSF